MSRKKNKLPLLEQIEIVDVAAEGKAIAKYEDLVIFVPFVAPGDIVDIQVTKKRKNYREGKAVKFHKYSENRIDAFCEHFSICGGCKWQHLKYEDQLFYKQKQVSDNLQRIGKVDVGNIFPILASKNTNFYRNKLEYTFSNRKWITDFNKNDDLTNENMNALGFHIPGFFDRVVDVKKCFLQKDPSNQIRLAVKKFADENNISYFDIRKQEGLLRNLIIRNTSTCDLMVIVVFFFEDKTAIKKLLDFLNDEFPEITSLMYIINEKKNDSISDQKVLPYKGKEYITEEMEGLEFRIGPKSFYQTNSEQAYLLYKITREFAGFKGDEIVYDLYTGTGTIANFIAPKVKKVVGIEYIPEAIEDANENSKINNIENTFFYAGDMAKVLDNDFVNENGKPQVIISDPPRAGMQDKVVKQLLNIEAEKIVYVSCNPATQARDVELLSEKYTVEKSQAVDMFPHTQHVENVVLLVKKTD